MVHSSRVVSMCVFGVIAIICVVVLSSFFFFKQKTAYEMRISDWSSDVCSSDLRRPRARQFRNLRIERADLVTRQFARPRAIAAGIERDQLGDLVQREPRRLRLPNEAQPAHVLHARSEEHTLNSSH